MVIKDFGASLSIRRYKLLVYATSRCFDPGTVSGALRVPMTASDPPKPKTALQLVTDGAQVGVDTVKIVSTLSGSPGGAIAAQRLGTLSAECNEQGGVQEKVSRDVSPTQVALGEGDLRMYLGALLMNPTMAVGIMALHVGLAAAYAKVSKKPFRQAVLAMRVTMRGMVAIILLVAQPTIESAFIVAVSGGGGAGAIIGAVCVMGVFAAVSAAVGYNFLYHGFGAVYTPKADVEKIRADATSMPKTWSANRAEDSLLTADPPSSPDEKKTKQQRHPAFSLRGWIFGLFLPEGEWMLGPLSVEDMCDSHAPEHVYKTVLATPLFMDYKGSLGGKYFMLVEFTVSALSGVSVAIEMVAGCIAGSVAVLVVLLAYSLLVFGLRPHALPFDRYLTYFFALGQVAAATTRLACVVRQEPIRGQTAVDLFVFSLMIAAMVRGVFDFYNFMRKLRVFFMGDRQKRVDAIVEAQGGDFFGETQPLKANDLMATGWRDDDDGNDDPFAIGAVAAGNAADIGDDGDEKYAAPPPPPEPTAEELEKRRIAEARAAKARREAQRDDFLDGLLDGPDDDDGGGHGGNAAGRRRRPDCRRRRGR